MERISEPGSRLRLHVDATALEGSEMWSVRERWEPIAARIAGSPFLVFGWLESWASVYQPRRLVLVEITDGELGRIALGLLEELPFGVLRFAGGPVTPVRALLCAPAFEARAWRALGEWLDCRSRWSLLEASGVAPQAFDLPAAVVTPVPWFAFALPGSFEAYLAARAAGPRREFRRRLRVAEREGATTSLLSGAAVSAGLDSFVRLHSARATAKGEVHEAIDERLAMMLNRVVGHGVPELRVFAVQQAGSTLGVGVQLDHAGETCAYNIGFDPAASRLSPGLLVRLASIRDAIERGGRHFDLGPGEFAYKRDLGGEADHRVRIEAPNSESVAGRLVRVGILSRHRLASTGWLRRGVGAWRKLRRTRATAA